MKESSCDYKTTLTLPEALFRQVAEEAEARNMDCSAYVQAVLAGGVWPADAYLVLLIEVTCLREAMATDRVDAIVKRAVLSSCRRIEHLLAEKFREVK